jgi:hypothetical protein
VKIKRDPTSREFLILKLRKLSEKWMKTDCESSDLFLNGTDFARHVCAKELNDILNNLEPIF